MIIFRLSGEAEIDVVVCSSQCKFINSGFNVEIPFIIVGFVPR